MIVTFIKTVNNNEYFDTKNREKISFFQSSSAANTCIVSNVCNFGEEIIRNRDFQSVCQSCFKKIKTQLKMKQKKEMLFQEGTKMAEKHFLRWRSKQSSFLAPPTKKQLLYDKSNISQPKSISAVSITVRISLLHS